MTFSIDAISALLDRQSRAEETKGDDAVAKTKAAVAMILRRGSKGLELLFILRSLHKDDPWSGNVAFPGGKVEAGEQPRQAAERETIEEIGLHLEKAALFLGRMPVVAGSYLPVQVSCFVYLLNGPAAEMTLNGEVQDTFWANLDDLADPGHHLNATVMFRNEEFVAPAIRLDWPGAPVLWGLTYRLAMHFLEMCRAR